MANEIHATNDEMNEASPYAHEVLVMLGLDDSPRRAEMQRALVDAIVAVRRFESSHR